MIRGDGDQRLAFEAKPSSWALACQCGSRTPRGASSRRRSERPQRMGSSRLSRCLIDRLVLQNAAEGLPATQHDGTSLRCGHGAFLGIEADHHNETQAGRKTGCHLQALPGFGALAATNRMLRICPNDGLRTQTLAVHPQTRFDPHGNRRCVRKTFQRETDLPARERGDQLHLPPNFAIG